MLHRPPTPNGGDPSRGPRHAVGRLGARRSVAVSWVLALALGACGGSAAAVSATSAEAGAVGTGNAVLPSVPSDPRTVVTLVATLRGGPARGGTSSALVEEALRSFRPDVVLVEVPPFALDEVLAEVDAATNGPTGSWIRQLPELYEIVLPLRHSLGYTVVPVSGWTERARVERAAYFAEHPHGPREREYIIANAAFHAAFIENHGADNPEWVHGPEFIEALALASRWLSYFAEDAMGFGGELRVQARHVALIEDALEAHRGARVMIVFEATSRYFIEPTVKMRSDCRFEPVTRFLR